MKDRFIDTTELRCSNTYMHAHRYMYTGTQMYGHTHVHYNTMYVLTYILANWYEPLLKAFLVERSSGSSTRVKWPTSNATHTRWIVKRGLYLESIQHFWTSFQLYSTVDYKWKSCGLIRIIHTATPRWSEHKISLLLTKLTRRILHRHPGGVTYLWDDLTSRANYPTIVGLGSK